MQRITRFSVIALGLTLFSLAHSTAQAEIVKTLEEGRKLAESSQMPLVLDFAAQW